MNTESTTMPSSQPAVSASLTRPLYWSVRRELWENRSIYIAPLVAAGVVLFGFLIHAFRLPHRRGNALALDPTHMRAAIEAPYDMVAMMIMFVSFVVAIFYCLDALYGERRDRSILFWKSLPVSDFTIVLSKALIPVVILPLVTLATIIGLHLVMLLLTTLALLPAGLAKTTFAALPILRIWGFLAYWLVTDAIWQAPVYGWLLLVSGFARRATFLWAVLPWLAICAIEKLAFNTAYFATMLVQRLTGGVEEAFDVAHFPKGTQVPGVDRLTQLDPLKLLSSPGLWIGLLFAVVFFAAAVRLRRDRGPL